MVRGNILRAGSRRQVEPIACAVEAVMETMEQRMLLSAGPLYTYT